MLSQEGSALRPLVQEVESCAAWEALSAHTGKVPRLPQLSYLEDPQGGRQEALSFVVVFNREGN